MCWKDPKSIHIAKANVSGRQYISGTSQKVLCLSYNSSRAYWFLSRGYPTSIGCFRHRRETSLEALKKTKFVPQAFVNVRECWRKVTDQAKELERVSKKAARKFIQARTRMGAGKCQPGIADMFKSAAVIANSWKSSKTAEFTTKSNRPSNVSPGILGQSNGSTSNVPVMGGRWGQDEHPPMTWTHEGED